MHKLAVTVVVLVLAVAVAAQQGWIPDVGGQTQAHTPRGDEEPPPSGPGLAIQVPAAAPVVLNPVRAGGNLRRKAVAAALGDAVRSKDLGKHLGLRVERLGSNSPAYQLGDQLVTPASTLKLLTSTAALNALGPGHRFSTRVVSGPTRRSIVLVGGGDPLLTGRTPSRVEAAATYPVRASLQDLARRTAVALKQRGVTAVRLSYDVTLYAGPSVNPQWEPTYIAEDVVSPIVPLWIDEGREVDGYSPRSADPSREAARRFSTFLAAAGVKVRGVVAPRRAGRTAKNIASVQSAPLAQIVQHVLALSDNEGAETLLRQTAIADGRPGSFTAGVKSVRRELADLGVATDRLTMYDGSGLSRKDAVPLSALTSVLQIAADPANPQLREVISTLPVAGFTGSLAYRFVDDAPAGLGVVRAKTGTLSGVHGLAGLVVTKRGTPLIFAEVADRVPLVKTLDARARLDQIAALLATCSC